MGCMSRDACKTDPLDWSVIAVRNWKREEDILRFLDCKDSLSFSVTSSSLCFRFHLLKQESIWVSLMRILMASFNFMYVTSASESLILQSLWMEAKLLDNDLKCAIFFSFSLFATGNGILCKRSYSQFGTTPGHACVFRADVLPHSRTQILFLLWST